MMRLPSVRCKVRLIFPDYPYKGVIVGRDNDFVYLDTSIKEDKCLGVICIPINNIRYVEELKEVSL